jgi:large subunit ribosomal protein L24
MASSMHVRRGDKVRVIAGKESGKEGKILRAYPEKQRVTVEGANIIKRATRPSQKNPQGGILQHEGTMHVSNVMLICPNCSQPSRIGRRRENGELVRVCKKCGGDIDK